MIFCDLAGNCLFTPLLERFLGMWLFKYEALLTGPPKGTSLCGTTQCSGLGASLSEEPTNEKTKKRSRVKTISRIRGSKIPERIVMKFCMTVGLPDVVTRAKLNGDRFSHFCVVGVEFQVFPLTLVVVLTIRVWYNRLELCRTSQ